MATIAVLYGASIVPRGQIVPQVTTVSEMASDELLELLARPFVFLCVVSATTAAAAVPAQRKRSKKTVHAI